jgi:hypothetical protein
VKEAAIGRREDGMIVATPEQTARLAELNAAVAGAKKNVSDRAAEIDAAQTTWEQALTANAPAGESEIPRAVAAVLKKTPAKRTAREKQTVQTHFRAKVSTVARAELDALAAVERTQKAYVDALPHCLVSESTTVRRTVRVLPRGNWMDESGEIVAPAFPGFLSPSTANSTELSRLDLARWLVSRENPLTARAFVNRLWAQFFGTALSRVPGDLGAQGETPPNGPLLDWLASEFMDSGWDVKHLVRTIVTSATYRQSSVPTPAQLAADPENREHARQSRFRVEAELVRDHALAAAGLLSPWIGGPSVKPYQPARYWEMLNFPTRDYDVDRGEAQYRRGLYVWWQRSFLHPSLLAFDAPSREECVAERGRSNLPQQALVLLNDPTYVEAARAFAARIVTAGGATAAQRLAWAWSVALQRAPRTEEVRTATALWTEQLRVYRADPAAADALLATGDAAVPAGLDRAELAAWTHVARVLLNVHEFITRE